MSLEDKIKDVTIPLLEGVDMELFDLEVTGRSGKKGRRTLRVFIEKEGGVTVDDCAKISHQLGMALEADEVIDGPYLLEVSSPGLTRPLKTPRHFQSSVGKLALIKVKGTTELAKQTGGKLIGIIEATDENGITLLIRESDERHQISFDDIAHANLELEF